MLRLIFPRGSIATLIESRMQVNGQDIINQGLAYYMQRLIETTVVVPPLFVPPSQDSVAMNPSQHLAQATDTKTGTAPSTLPV